MFRPERVDGAGGTHELIRWLTERMLAHPLGFTLPNNITSIHQTLALIPDRVWAPA